LNVRARLALEFRLDKRHFGFDQREYPTSGFLRKKIFFYRGERLHQLER
jgi:hypothetical protein